MMRHSVSQRSGNIFFMLFGAIAIVGAFGMQASNTVKGLITSMSDVTRKTVAEEKMNSGARLAVQNATATQSNAGDCDTDGMVEPLPYRDAGAGVKPTGGGYLPLNIGASLNDPWGTTYGYCAWDPGNVRTTDNNVGCGGSTAKRLNGAPSSMTQPVVAIISAGKNRRFETSCNAYVDTTPADGNPDTPLIGRATGGDDVIMEYTYNDASGLSGDDLWKVRDTKPTMATIDKNIEVTGSGQFTGALNLMEKGLVLPTDAGNDTTTGPCDTTTDQQLRMNIGLSPPSLEICANNDWAPIIMADNGGECTSDLNTWTERYTFPVTQTRSIASSADGRKLAVAVFGRQIYTSADSGVTWTARNSNRDWSGIASSADGTKLVAVVNNDRIYTSTDSGATWTSRATSNQWQDVASSSDGVKLAATASSSQIYTSTDSGVTWTARATNRVWRKIASSSDGVKLVAYEATGQIYTSADSGVTWTARESNRSWNGLASSSDGTKLAAAVSSGQIYISTDSGLTWTPRDTNRGWTDVASSADGMSLVAITAGGQIYTTSNGGTSWSARATARNWTAVAMSTDGSRLAATADTKLYTTCSPLGQLAETAPDIATAENLLKTPDFLGCASDGGGPFVKISESAPGILGRWVYGDDTYVYSNGAGQGFSAYTKVGGVLSRVANINTNTSARVWSDGAYVYYGDGLPDLHMMGFNGSAFSTVATFNDATGVGNSIWGDGTYLYLAEGASGLLALSPNGGTLTKVAQYDSDGTATHIWGDGTYLYLSDNFGGLQILTFNGSSFTTVLVLPGVATESWGDGRYLYVNTGGTLKIYTFDGSALTEVGSDATAGLVSIWGNGNHIFLGYTSGKIAAARFDGTNLQIDSTYTVSAGTVYGIWGDGNHIYVGQSSGPLVSLSGFSCGVSAAPSPAVVVGANQYQGKISAGTQGTCAIKQDNTAWCWGDDFYLQIGNGATLTADQSTPSIVNTLNNNFIQISQGNTHSCGIKADGSAWCWGRGIEGQIGNSGTGNQHSPVAVTSTSSWSQISAGVNSTCGLENTGQISCWGTDTYGQLGNNAGGNSTVPAAITETGPWVYVSSRGYHACGIKTDGSAWCWGLNTSGQLGNNSLTDSQIASPIAEPGPWIQIETGAYHSCALKLDGTIWCWGKNNYGLLGDGGINNTVMVPQRISDPGPFLQVSASYGSTVCGIKYDGTAWCWGLANKGQAGNPLTNALTPRRIVDPGPWAFLSTSAYHTCGIKIDGSAWCWGEDVDGKLGNGSVLTADQPLPQSVVSFLDPQPFAWNDTQTALVKNASAATISLGSGTTGGAIGYDGDSGGLSFTSAGNGLLRNPVGNSHVIIQTSFATSDAIMSFETVTAANTRSMGIDYLTRSFEFGMNNASVNNWMYQITPQIEIAPTGYVGVGTTGAPAARLDINNGGLKLGTDIRACAPSRDGILRYIGGATPFEYCNGSIWVAF